MSSEYDKETAFHYASYRPPLHEVVLKKCLKGQKFKKTLDIGCGTGVSSIALCPYSNSIIGLEPNETMLKEAISHPFITYQIGNAELIPYPKASFDLVTLAGVLYYAKSQNLINEISRVIKNSGIVLIYDFDVLYRSYLEEITAGATKVQPLKYNHQVDFSGLNLMGLKREKSVIEETIFSLNPEELGHIMLASKIDFETLTNCFGSQRNHNRVSKKIESCYGREIRLAANLYYSIYSKI
ncbi:class I SAM-dependent methyltransferase [Eudoraea sp.]|uniref:class I SAM-dependent methyltransferase n=1 Tax=Eudoraea sp. TaxID=1979955 RepID=UPI003C788060